MDIVGRPQSQKAGWPSSQGLSGSSSHEFGPTCVFCLERAADDLRLSRGEGRCDCGAAPSESVVSCIPPIESRPITITTTIMRNCRRSTHSVAVFFFLLPHLVTQSSLRGGQTSAGGNTPIGRLAMRPPRGGGMTASGIWESGNLGNPSHLLHQGEEDVLQTASHYIPRRKLPS